MWYQLSCGQRPRFLARVRELYGRVRAAVSVHRRAEADGRLCARELIVSLLPRIAVTVGLRSGHVAVVTVHLTVYVRWLMQRLF